MARGALMFLLAVGALAAVTLLPADVDASAVRAGKLSAAFRSGVAVAAGSKAKYDDFLNRQDELSPDGDAPPEGSGDESAGAAEPAADESGEAAAPPEDGSGEAAAPPEDGSGEAGAPPEDGSAEAGAPPEDGSAEASTPEENFENSMALDPDLADINMDELGISNATSTNVTTNDPELQEALGITPEADNTTAEAAPEESAAVDNTTTEAAPEDTTAADNTTAEAAPEDAGTADNTTAEHNGGDVAFENGEAAAVADTLLTISEGQVVSPDQATKFLMDNGIDETTAKRLIAGVKKHYEEKGLSSDDSTVSADSATAANAASSPITSSTTLIFSVASLAVMTVVSLV